MSHLVPMRCAPFFFLSLDCVDIIGNGGNQVTGWLVLVEVSKGHGNYRVSRLMRVCGSSQHGSWEGGAASFSLNNWEMKQEAL